MNHYIDAHKFVKDLEQACVHKAVVFSVLDRQPAADVVPRSEVDELKAIIADHKASEERLEKLYSNAKSEVKRLQSEVTTLLNDLAVATLKCENAEAEAVRKIFAEIERLLAMHFCSCLPKGATEHYDYYEGDLGEAIAELKKKYPEREVSE